MLKPWIVAFIVLAATFIAISFLRKRQSRPATVATPLSKSQGTDVDVLRRRVQEETRPGAMSYMMSRGAWLDGGGNLAHLMFYTPPDAKWGEDLPGTPVFSIPQSVPDRFSLFMIPTGRWSDGTAAPMPD